MSGRTTTGTGFTRFTFASLLAALLVRFHSAEYLVLEPTVPISFWNVLCSRAAPRPTL